MKAQLAFYKGGTEYTDRLIQWWTKSKYSHVEIVYNNLWYSSSPRDYGVRQKEIEMNPEHWDLFDIEIDPILFLTFFYDTVGMDYDWTGIFLSQVLHINVEDKKRYFCSEWCAEALGIPSTLSNKYNPEDLYQYYLKNIQYNN